ncbi:hypothetical protein Mtc_1527 [Methanocella conradii HZ254]|uniref:Uncharacterized protein n=1 Tax=Methanocella conradii (strain DSM 24694 / JCM 17849 / CGMCC 1.5162 / HZ254) TaxID=1041930 RepID=H8I728_METCZ|nr:hypothetical protein Mtc_1527 [Methanocella conradii HZ254]
MSQSSSIPLKLSQNDLSVRINVFNMTFPPRKKRRCIEKTPDGEVEEICVAMEDSRYRGEEAEERFRLKGID